MEGILSVNGPAQVTPFRYNSALYNTLGPFTGDNFDYGIGFPEAYPNGPQDILVTTVLDRNEFADHIGEEIVGFRFALYGDAAKTVKVSDFIAWPYYSQEGFDQDHLYEWTLTDLVGNTEPGGGDEPGPGGETTYQYVKITSADDLTSGQYLIVCESQNVAFNGSLAASGLSATNNQASVTITNSTIESNATTDGMAFTYDATATSLQSASGYYIGRQSGTSGGALEALSSAYAHTILFSSGVPSIRCTSTNGNNTYYLRYNSDSNCFRYYTSSSQTAIQLYKKVAVNNSKGGKKANRRANRTTVTVASSDFSSSSGWTIIDANNDGSTWSISSSGYAAYNYNQNNAANDWLVYSSIALEAGKTYTFNLDAWRRGTNYPEKLEVKFASANTATALSAGTTIIAETTVTSTSQTSPNALSNTFTVTSSGNYYIGIHATSAKDMYTLYVDNMLITTESNDPTIIASTNSVNLSATPNGTASETITVTGENLTTDITATISGTDASLFSVSPATTGGGNLTITYSPTAVGTHSATLTLSSTGAQDVTVALTGTCSTDVTICDGTVTNNYLPIYGYYYDNVQINQIIYPASLLTNLNGKKITSMTFYSPHLYFSGGKFTVKVGETSQASFSSAVRNTADLTAVVVTDMAAPTAGGTELTITFATPYEYNGGNLLFDFEVTETGSYGTSQTSFYGITQTGGGFNSNASSGSSTNSNGVYSNGTVRNFLPKVTFAVEDNGGDNNDGYVALEPGQWHEFYLDAPVTFDVEDDDDMLFMGYWYKQYPLSSSNDEVMNPAAVNSESTGHYHFVNMVAEANVAGDIVISLPGSTMNVSSITVYDSNSNEIASWNATTAFNNGQYTQVTVGSNNRYNYTLPTGWSIASGNYFLVYSGDQTNYYGYLYAAGDLTIASSALNGNTTVTVVIRGMDDNGGVTVSVNGDGKTIGTSETDYTWSNVDLTTTGYARNWYNINLSEVGDLAVQLIFKTIKTAAPTITGEVDPNNENNYVITATGDGTVTLTVGETTVTGNGTASITIPRTDVDQTVTATATAQETGKEESDPTTETFTVPKLVTADPVITYVVNDDNVVITATGDGTVTLTVGETTVTGNGTASITVPRTDVDQTVTASATAQETGKAVSNTVTENVTIPLVKTDTPTITYVVNGDNVVITATGDGTVTLTVGNETVSGNGSASITVPRTDVDQTVTATATAQESGKAVSDPATENITVPALPITATPTITYVVNGDNVVITATGDGTVTLTVGNETVSGNGSASITVPRTDVDQNVTATATALETNHQVSATATENITVPALPQTATPTITYVVNDDSVVITATGNGTVTLTVGNETVSGEGSVSITVPRTDVDQTVTATATALETSHIVSDPATENITVPALPQTATPVITYTYDGETVIITATGNGTVTLTVGNETVSGEGSASITLPFGVVSSTVTATATAQETNHLVSETATEQVPIPAGDGWLPMDGTYDNPSDLLSFEYLGKEIMLIDQFKASTLYNTHPDGYTYTLREVVDREVKSSSPVDIPVYKTSSTMQGLYTLSQVESDVDMHLTAQALNSKMCNDVNPDHNTLYSSLYRGDVNANYPEIDVESRVSQLQKYEVNENNLIQYYFTENHTSGVTPRYDQVGNETVERLDTNYVQASVGQELTYVPVIWTFGLYTGREDGKNNSYGSDIKREKLGGVNIISIEGSKSGGNNAENTGQGWEGTFYVGNELYCIYTPIITVEGITPETLIQHDGDTSRYEPYMYRVWCLYDGALDFSQNAQGVLVGGDPMRAPFLLGEQEITDPNVNRITIGRDWIPGEGRLPWAFAVPVSTQSSDVQFAVRFYYKKKVSEAQAAAKGLRGNRDGEENEYYIVEDTGNGSSIGTAINEFLAGKTIVGVTYVNAQGMTSDKPFDGMNIVITRYSDGTSSTTKLMPKH